MENFLENHEREQTYSEVYATQFTFAAGFVAALVGLAVWWLCSY
jgi:hypothetical protein